MDVSFEFFPPKTNEGLIKLLDTASQLEKVSPSYYSVTYGAGGSTKETTVATVQAIYTQIGNAVVPHISCLGASKSTIIALLNQYKKMNIRRLIALRGDLPSGDVSVSGDFKHATELVSFIRAHSGDYFQINVAVYPECHPQSDHTEMDLYYFKQKVQAGANGAITQYFYDPNAYYWLLENCSRLGIHIPITPGIMPITNFKQLARFSALCGADIPRWVTKRLISYADDVASIKAFGVEVVAKLCEQLITMGAPGLHFYTLNNADAVLKILAGLNMTERVPESVTV